jgi:hypothetical protein
MELKRIRRGERTQDFAVNIERFAAHLLIIGC